MVHGQAYLAFVTLVIPQVFKDMQTPRLALDTNTGQPTTLSDYDSDSEHHQQT